MKPNQTIWIDKPVRLLDGRWILFGVPGHLYDSVKPQTPATVAYRPTLFYGSRS